MYDKVSPDLKFVEREQEVLSFWDQEEIFKKSIAQREGGPVFTFYDGPPTANGKPHIGHVLTRVIKDLIPRYRTMKGYKVLRKAGWDTHGLPVELEVEKALGLDGKEQIEEYGMEPFIEKCKESVWKYKSMWEQFSARVGFWADMEHPYVTYENDYIESIWWALKKMFDEGLLYKGHKIVPYCPRCGTPLSSHEVAQGYKDVEEETIFVRFKVKGAEDEYFIAWTTTPWTLPSNVALCVNPRETYAKVRYEGAHYYMAEALLDSVMGEGYEIEETFTGKDLEFMEYEPLFPYAKPDKKAWFVTCGDYVTLSDGTGIVHIAPAFGEDDAQIGHRYDLPFVQLVDAKGAFVGGTPWDGIFVKKADPDVIEALKAEGKWFKSLRYTHSYPHCWRCDTPLLYYAKDTWFIAMTKVRDRLLANNKTVNWLPKSIGERRFGDWLENVIDWGVSRDRYWGTPLNIWECPCGHRHAIGSIAELKELGDDVPDNIELHRPFIDAVYLTCPHCGQKMKRVENVIDCWFDSGAMPFAQWHYPFENEETFKENFPADFISEAVDQTRGWFYSLLAISTVLFDEAPYKNVIVLGLVQDEDGQKMSKSKGNAVDPVEVLDKFGADAIRWYFYTNSAPWLPNRFYDEAVLEGQRKFMGTLWNTYAFFVLYANIDSFDPTQYALEYDKLSIMDRWLLSKLNSLIVAVDSNLEQYRITEAAKALDDFVDELSNWYVRRSRERFWGKDMPQDKINAYMTLYEALVTLAKLSAPFVPFMAEQIYRNLVVNVDKCAPESVHLCLFPEVKTGWILPELEASMEEVLKIVVEGRSCRNTASIKNRQPIGTMYVKAPGEALLPEYQAIIAEELNVKEVIFTQDVRSFTTYSFKPQLRTVGPKYGKLVGKIRQLLSEVDGNEAMDQLRSGKPLTFDIDGQAVELSEEDLLIESAQKEGFVAETEGELTVVLDTNLTADLLEEGFVREIISKVQTMRKEAGFEVMDHICFAYGHNERITSVVNRNQKAIMEEVLADCVQADVEEGFYEKEWNVNGETVTFGVRKQ
ncbi:isoleucine--tRNA ligase [Bianquea renquensis]|jgi:isoleucine--tRNA ligase|uniref:Isoleucine--tRNA ligase n=1 Tax=Bianquea renquensis TaxID=2763661 RepID=A0A926DNM8_9FIRM|nr:isoleucine--tRNA ligase [Bianquea renquensis]MBC8542320.1 isoleucine--tRNA ligase [Bianquea renquensis]